MSQWVFSCCASGSFAHSWRRCLGHALAQGHSHLRWQTTEENQSTTIGQWKQNWLFRDFLGNYTTQLYCDYNKPWNKDPYEPTLVFSGNVRSGRVFFGPNNSGFGRFIFSPKENVVFEYQSLDVCPQARSKFYQNSTHPPKRGIGLIWPPFPVTVTTRVITCLGSGIHIKLHFPLLQGGGHIQGIHLFCKEFHGKIKWCGRTFFAAKLTLWHFERQQSQNLQSMGFFQPFVLNGVKWGPYKWPYYKWLT